MSKAIYLIPLLAVSSTLLAKDPVLDDSHTLDWPVGYDQAIEFASGNLHNPTGETAVVFDQDLKVAGAAWLQVHFQDIRLEGDSFIRLTSSFDGEVQEMDATMLMLWRNHSAYFNGDTLRVELVADPATFNNEFTIAHVSMEELVIGTDRGDGCGICGNDDRAPSDVDYAARMMPVGCTSTMYNDAGCFVSAGHCLGSTTTLQFNVPASSSNCSLNQPPVADQFPIIEVDGANGGVGDDYAAGRIGTNNLGQTHYERYGVYVPLAGTTPSNGTLEVWGFGVDSECVRTQTQQYHNGSHEGLSSDAIYYDIDITYGNSGSSIIQNNTIVGIVTHCSYECFNYGTRIDKPAFETLRAEMCDVAVGACCVGSSCAVIPESNCGGTFLGDGTTCSGDPCAPNGACCVGTSCSVSTEADCGGDWLGAGSDCSLSPCAPILGACCTENDCSVIDKDDCNGSFLGEGTDCSGDPCGLDPTGACCSGTSCSIVTQADCSGNYLGDGTSCVGNPCGAGDDAFLGLAYSIVGSNLVDDAEPTWTVDVYAVLGDNCRLDAVAGDSTTSKMVSTTSSFYQNIYGGNTSAAINPALFGAFPDLRYDSFMTIGRFDSDDNNLSDIGIDFSNFQNGGAIDSSDGSWFCTPDDSQGDADDFQNESCESGNGVLIARLTVRDLSASVYVEALFQGKNAAGNTWQASDNLSIIYDDCNGSFCDGDFNQDGVVDVSDLLNVIANWGNPYDVADLLLVIADWGCTG